MPFTVTMPKLSPTMENGTIVKWHKAINEYVKADELLLEVATDKATVEYNALDSGWLRKIIVSAGQDAVVNQAIAIFTEEKEESIEGYKPTGITPAPQEKTAEVAQEKEPIKEKTTAKSAALSQPSFVPEKPLENYQFHRPLEAGEKRIKASPLARKLAKERGLDISTIQGSGPHQRIVAKDLELALPAGEVTFGKREHPSLSPGSFEEETLSPMKKVIGQRLQESKSFIPHFYVEQQVDAEPLVMIREQLARNEIKLTINDFIVRACALALRKHPEVNSGYNSVNQTLIRFKTVDISVAVNVNGGLITPIIRHADFKNIGELSVEVKYLAKKAKEGKLEAEEYKGGSFTISNLGMFGVTNFQAIINPPQAAILAVSAVQDVPVVKEGKIVPGKTMSITLSVDHRVIDGASAALYIKTLKHFLENPALLLI